MGAGAALAGGLQSFMQGYDYQNQLNRQKELDAEREQERATQRQREATQWNQSQEDRQHTLERRPVLEKRQDEQYGLQHAIAQGRLKQTQHALERQPILDQQKDEAFQSLQRVRQQQAHMNRLRAEAAQMGIDGKRLEQRRQQIGQAMGAGWSQYEMTGSTQPLVDTWNKQVTGTALDPIQQLTKNRDGSFTLQMRGSQPLTVPDDQHLMATIATALNPDNFLKIYHHAVSNRAAAEAARAKNPQRFSELIRSNDGQLQRYDYETGGISPVTDKEGRPITGTLAGRSRGKSPEEIAIGLYQNYVKNHLRPQQAEQRTAEFMRRAYPDAVGWWNDVPQQQKPQSHPGLISRLLGSSDEEQDQPGSAQGHGSIVRTGTKNGVRVAQYQDGTIAPIQ